MIKKILFLFALCVFWGNHAVLAQGADPERPAIRVPSANAASLGKYGDIPVSYYTGTPNISVPITDLTVNDISIGLSLSYHGSGIKVEEEASWVGLGWSLNAGGVITRCIRGTDDFPENYSTQGVSAKGFFKEGAIPDYKLPFIFATYSFYEQGEYAFFANTNGQGGAAYHTLGLYQSGVQYQSIDGEPDIFNFNFNGHSGKFLINKKRNNDESYHIVLYSKEDLKIELVNNDLTGQQGFKIIDSKGHTYWFQKLEISRSRSGPSRTGKLLYDPSQLAAPGGWQQLMGLNRDIRNDQFGNYYHGATGYSYNISSWHLTKITSPNGAEINFTYSEQSFYTKSLPTRSQKVLSTENHTNPYNWDFSFTLNETKNVYLQQIAGAGFTVDFFTGDRIDMQATDGLFAKRLDRIEMSYQGVNTRKWQFFHDYYNSGSGHPDFISKRLKLNSVKATGTSEINGQTYSFEYINASPFILPDKDSYAQDMFGYFNGQLTNETKPYFVPLIPDYMTVSNLTPFSGIGNRASEREVHPEFLTTGILKKITYPTGGYTEFLFEPHDYGNAIAMNYYAGNYHLIPYNNSSIIDAPESGVVHDYSFTQGGGCRIKEILNSTDQNVVASKKVFTYKKLFTTEESSGKLMYALKPFSFEINFFSASPYYKLFSNSMIATPSSAAGSPIGYSAVQVVDVGPENTSNGFSEYIYENEVESNKSMFVFRYPCQTSPTATMEYTTDYSTPYFHSCSGFPNVVYRRNVHSINIPNVVHQSNGNLLEQSVYGNGLVQRTVNTYEERNIEKIKCIANHPFSDQTNKFTLIYHETSCFKALVKSVTTKDNVITTTDFSYHPSFSHYKVASTKTIDSKGESLYTAFKYPPDFPSIPVYDTMTKRNILSLVEQSSYKGNILPDNFLQGTKTNYNFWNGSSWSGTSKVFAHTFETKSSGQANYETRIRYYGYDALGNLRSYSKALDTKNAYIYGYGKLLPIAEVINADTTTIAYTSFEDADQGGWSLMAGGVYLTNNNNVTGKRSLSGGVSKTLPLGNYVLSFWSAANTWINGAAFTDQPVKNLGNGRRYFEKILTNTTSVQISGDNIDEVRIYPVGAQMSTFTYDPSDGMTSRSDAAGTITYYEYDRLGRLQHIRDERNNILKSICYNYAGQPEPCKVYYSSAKSQTFTRNNCGAGYQGGTYTYSVAANAYMALSQAEADQLALNDIAQNGQAAANANANCTQVFSSVDVSGYYFNQSCPSGTGTPVYVYMPAGSFASTISQQQANDDAIASAQAYADANGGCSAAEFYFNGSNSTYEGMTIILINTSTWENLYFYIYPNTNYASLLGMITPGFYHINIMTNNSYNWFNYNVGGYYGSFSGSTTLYDVYLDEYFNYINIY